MNKEEISSDAELYLSGYSEGGYVAMATHKYIEEDGVAKQIRNYGSDTAPHGRVTEVDVRKMSGRGTEARLTYEKLLTLDKKAKGFYSVKIKL